VAASHRGQHLPQRVERKERRVLPLEYGPEAGPGDPFERLEDVLWLKPHDQAAVEAHAAAILASDGRIDVSFNAISHGEVQGTVVSEVGPFGVRVVALRPNLIPETAPDMSTSDLEPLLSDTLTGRLPRLDEIASAAAFLVSDRDPPVAM